jgi:hypothetical protein
MNKPLALSLIVALAVPTLAHSTLSKAHHAHHRRAHHLVLEMKAGGRATPARPALARAGASQPTFWRGNVGARGGVATMGFNRGDPVRHPEELNGPGAARFNHSDSTVGAKVNVPF